MGLLVINDQLVLNAGNVNQKNEIETEYMKMLRNDARALSQDKSKQKFTATMFSVLNSRACSCFSCGSKNSTKIAREAERKKKIREVVMGVERK